MTKLHHMPHQAMVSENSTLTNIKKDTLKYMINKAMIWHFS